MHHRRFKMIACAAVCVASLGLGACATGANSGGTTGSNTQLQDIIQQVQQATITACAFQPTVSTVSQIIGTFTGAGEAIAAANEIARQICAAIATPKSARRGAAAPTAYGVVIHGKFVGR